MRISRPVVAFALLKECSEVLRTDLLGGISILIRPLIGDLGGQRFSGQLLSDRLSSSYGLAISPQALEDFLPRFIAAGLVVEQKISESVSEAIFADVDTLLSEQEKSDEEDFQIVFNKFLEFCKNSLSLVKVTLSDDELISALLTRLATFDFKAIEVKPDRTARDKSGPTTISGPTSKEDSEIEQIILNDSKLDILVAGFVKYIAEQDPGSLGLLIKVAEGALGAELVFDLQAPKIKSDLSKVTVVLDTPILLSLLDLSDRQHQQYAQEIIDQIVRSKAIPAVFRHSIEEAEGVLAAVKNGVRFGLAYGPTADRLRDRTYLTFFETMIGAIERRLTERGIKVIEPAGQNSQQFFTGVQENDLVSRLRFHLLEKRLARERDAQSVAETIRLRAGAHVPLEQIEASKYLFLTSNPLLQVQARTFLISQGIITRSEFSPIITDRYFAGLSWLIFGGSSGTGLPTAKLLANCSTALRARPDVIAKTKSFLARIDPQKAEHFEALMTRERAARYLTEITLGDSLLVTAENAEEIYEKVEEIAAEKVANAKDQFYGQQLEEKQRVLEDLGQDLSETKKALESLEEINSENEAALKFQEGQIELLANKLRKEKEQRRDDEETISSLKTRIEELDETTIRAIKEVNRAKKTAIKLALRKAEKALWLGRVIILVVFAGIAFALGYLDRFILPNVPLAYKNIANWGLLTFQILFFVASFWVFTDKLFGALVWNYSKAIYGAELLLYGYSSEHPEFIVDFENFTLESSSNEIQKP